MVPPIYKVPSAPAATVLPNALQDRNNNVGVGFSPVETVTITPIPWANSFFHWSTRNGRPFLKEDGTSLVGKEIKLKVIVYKTEAPGYETDRFVYVPDASNFVTQVNWNSFIRLEDVVNRLGPSAQLMYAQDKRLHKQGRHPFFAWDQNGTIKPIVNAINNYYRGLLFGTNNTYASHDRMFSKWFNIAAAATYPQKEPWTVISRFWDSNVQNCTLYFVVTSKLIERSVEGPQKLKESVIKVWESAKERKKKAEDKNALTTNLALKVPVPFAPAHCEVVGPNLDSTWRQGKQMVGHHPLDLYEVWATTIGLAKLPTYDFRGVQVVSTLTGPAAVLANQHIPVGTWTGDTITTLTPLKINVTRTLKRTADQGTVMGISSNNAANIVWQSTGIPLPLIGDAEWLHRSAWSYGGLGGADSQAASSQVAQNLFLGTAATNTSMLRVEEFIKRYVLKTGYTALVKTTAVDMSNELGLVATKKPCWLAPLLHYNFTLNGPGGNAAKTSFCVFNARERLTPLRFEFEVGRLLDNWYFGWGPPVALTDDYDEEYRVPL